MLARHELEREFRSLVGDVIARLRAKQTPFEAMESEWRAIESLDSDEREFCKATALMGLDPFDIEVNTAERIARVWNQTDPAIREEALGAAQEHSLVAVQDWLECWLESVEQARSGDDWKNVRNAIRRAGVSEDLPWRQGYVDARAVRGELADRLGRFEFAQDGPCAIWSDDVEESPSPRIQGCVASDSPSCVVVRRTEAGKRFLLARALGDYIGREESGPAILGTLETARQARSRAFAAEFLAPAEWLRTQVGSAILVDEEAVDGFAAELGVSSWVVRYQIQNHRIVEISSSVWPSG